jgi:stage II sporulation protein M
VKKLSKQRTRLLEIFFQEHTDFILRIGPIFILTFFVFIFSIIMGYKLGNQISPMSFEGVLSNIPDPYESTSIEMFAAIVYNNVLASFIFLISGLFIGIPPLMFIAFNGLFVGYIAYNAAQIQGLGFVFATILPHGVLEIPAIILCAAMGVGFGYEIIHKIFRREGLQEYVIESMRIFIKRIIPILALAAGIETALIYLLI